MQFLRDTPLKAFFIFTGLWSFANAMTQAELNADLIENCKLGNVSRVIELLDSTDDLKADINARGKFSNTPLLVACIYNHESLADALLARNPDINALNDLHFTALYIASAQGFTSVTQKLLDNNADMEIPDSQGMTPFHAAINFNKHDTMSLLSSRGANIHTRNLHGSTLLHTALLLEPANIDTLSFLMRNGADVTAADNNGITPFNLILNSNDPELYLVFINCNVPENIRKNLFEPFFFIKTMSNNKSMKVIRALLDKGMNINGAIRNDRNGWSMLHYACGTVSIDIAVELTIRGANPEAKDNAGRIPFDLLNNDDKQRLPDAVNIALSARSTTAAQTQQDTASEDVANN